MDSEFTVTFPTQTGDLTLEFKLQFQEQKLQSLSVSNIVSIDKRAMASKVVPDNKAAEKILQQLKKYFFSAIPFQTFSLEPKGTAFQKSVWQELIKIPIGETRTYGEIANKLNSSARAVGNACRKNPIQIIVPCHRVISAKGLGGYAGETEGYQINIKRWLLNHEGVML